MCDLTMRGEIVHGSRNLMMLCRLGLDDTSGYLWMPVSRETEWCVLVDLFRDLCTYVLNGI